MPTVFVVEVELENDDDQAVSLVRQQISDSVFQLFDQNPNFVDYVVETANV